MKNVIIGLFFAMLWASASVPTKIAIRSADPLVVANVRFLIAGSLLLLISFVRDKKLQRPQSTHEWQQLFAFSLFNTTLYLGAFVLSMPEISAGIGSLATATGPLFVILISAVWLKRSLKMYEILGVLVGMFGAGLATWPLLQTATATPKGLGILMFGIVCVSVASVHYARVKWTLPISVFNGWQILLAGLTLLPFTLVFADWEHTRFDMYSIGGIAWLVLPVSIICLQLWFYLLKQEPVKASLWLFLCPIFGFLYASVILDEPLSWHTLVGTILVISGLYVAQREKFTKPQN